MRISDRTGELADKIGAAIFGTIAVLAVLAVLVQ